MNKATIHYLTNNGKSAETARVKGVIVNRDDKFIELEITPKAFFFFKRESYRVEYPIQRIVKIVY